MYLDDLYVYYLNEQKNSKISHIINELEILLVILDIESKNILEITKADSVFLKGITLQNGISNIMKELEIKEDKYLSIRYKIKGKQFTLKSFGKISKIDNKKMLNIIKFTVLIKLLNEIKSTIHLSSEMVTLEKKIKSI